jgi:2-polyprenyl-3-methyl-5-hydroxy-6-metoxy-1,4-benzoquinol methylase
MKDVYTKLFNTNYYSIHNINDPHFQFVKEYIIKNDVESVYDVGSGRGYLLELIEQEFPHIKLVSSDYDKFHQIDCFFYKIDLNDKLTYSIIDKVDLLVCLNVLEHVEEDSVNNILEYFSKISKNHIFAIANHEEFIDGIELHKIQKDKNWWDLNINKYFDIKFSDIIYNDMLYLYICENL